MALAVNVGDVAWPFAAVLAVAVLVPVLENVPLAPEAGAVNVTVTPLTAAPAASFTTTTKGVWKAAPVTAD
jgi:hypothetical protein